MRFLGFGYKSNPLFNFLLEYKCTKGLPGFCKSHMSRENLKNLQANQNARFFKLKCLTNKLRYEEIFLYVVTHPVISSDCGPTCLVMPKFAPNSESG